jgi:2-polyprenyl-3-methyl-5-hydroxy-6-metoxy-1,4-benzoquinol methylase
MPVERWPEWSCPEHRQVLTDEGATLRCPQGHSFPVADGIPRFVEESNYASHFGAQWNRYRTTQLDSRTGRPITRERMRRCLGPDLWSNLRGKLGLECGCGAGRFTEVLLAEGSQVVSIDLSSAVTANADNFPVNETHRIAQADILKLPFPAQQFDLVFCLGVIQHTPDPEATIASLYSQVAPGGALIIDHYTYEIGWYTKSAPLFRAILKRLPEARALAVTEKLVDIFLPWHKLVKDFRPGRMIVHRISPVLSFYALYPELDDKLQREWALLDTHDSLTDWYKHFRTRGQILRTLEQLGLERIWCEYGGNGIEARGYRPLR